MPAWAQPQWRASCGECGWWGEFWEQDEYEAQFEADEHNKERHNEN